MKQGQALIKPCNNWLPQLLSSLIMLNNQYTFIASNEGWDEVGGS